MTAVCNLKNTKHFLSLSKINQQCTVIIIYRRGFKHCDLSALLREMQGLRSEIRGLRCMEEDIQRLKQEVAELRQQLKTAKTSSSGHNIDEFPSLPSLQ